MKTTLKIVLPTGLQSITTPTQACQREAYLSMIICSHMLLQVTRKETWDLEMGANIRKLKIHKEHPEQ